MANDVAAYTETFFAFTFNECRKFVETQFLKVQKGCLYREIGVFT